MWSPGRPRRTRLRRTNALSSPSLAGPTRLPPAEAAAAEPAAATVLAAPSPTSDVVGLGRWRALGFVAPALSPLYIGATNYRLTGVAARTPDLVGLDNYRRALRDPTFYRSLRLTLVFVLGSAVVGQNVLGFALAYALRSARAVLRRLMEALVLLAWILPSSVVAFLWIALLDRDEGTVNVLIGQTPGVAWLVQYPMTGIVVFNIWRGTAFSMMLYAAALSSLPTSTTPRSSVATWATQVRSRCWYCSSTCCWRWCTCGRHAPEGVPNEPRPGRRRPDPDLRDDRWLHRVLRAAAAVAAVRALRRHAQVRRAGAVPVNPRQLRRDRAQPVRPLGPGQLGRAGARDDGHRGGRRGAGRVRPVAGAHPRPRCAALHAAAAVEHHHGYRGHGADLPADLPAQPDRLAVRRRARPLWRAASRGDLPAERLHRHGAALLRGVGPRLRRLAAADPAPHRGSGRPAGAGHDRGLDDRPGVGQLPHPVHPAARSGQAAGRGPGTHVLHRGRLAQPRADLHLLAVVLDTGGADVPVRVEPVRLPLPRRDQGLTWPR